MLRDTNSVMRLMLTVSPVPLTATAGHEHVLPATVFQIGAARDGRAPRTDLCRYRLFPVLPAGQRAGAWLDAH